MEKNKLERLKEATGMTTLGQMLVEDGIKIGEKRGIKIGELNGKLNGKLEALLDILSDYGAPDEELLKKIQSEDDLNTLNQWIKLAARAGSILDFKKQIQ